MDQVATARTAAGLGPRSFRQMRVVESVSTSDYHLRVRSSIGVPALFPVRTEDKGRRFDEPVAHLQRATLARFAPHRAPQPIVAAFARPPSAQGSNTHFPASTPELALRGCTGVNVGTCAHTRWLEFVQPLTSGSFIDSLTREQLGWGP